MESIHKILGFTEGQYQDLIFHTMVQWCDLYAKSDSRQLQILLANRCINNWFRLEFSKLLKQFREELGPFEKESRITVRDKQQLFTNTVRKIYDIYPSALISEKRVIYKSKFKSN